jgi:hypothetical protein
MTINVFELILLAPLAIGTTPAKWWCKVQHWSFGSLVPCSCCPPW